MANDDREDLKHVSCDNPKRNWSRGLVFLVVVLALNVVVKLCVWLFR